MKTKLLLLIFSLLSGIVYGQWKRTGGPGGNTITALMVDGNRVFAGTNGGNGSQEGGLFTATDTSFAWQQTGRSTFGNVKILALHKVGNVLLAGTEAQGVYRSLDNGSTWQPSSSGLTGSALYARCFLQQGHYTYVGTSGSGVYQSSDTGKTWFSVNAGLAQNAYCLAMAKAKNKIYLKTESQGQFRSGDSAATWQPINNMPVTASTGYLIAAVNDTIYAGCDRFLLKSSDEGITWRKVLNWPLNAYVTAIQGVGNQVYVGAEGNWLWRLHNDSLTAYPVEDSGMVARSIGQLGVYNNQLIAGAWRASGLGSYGQSLGGGVYKYYSTKKVWKQAIYGLFPDIHVNGIYSVDNFLFAVPENAVGSCQGLFRSSDEGKTWQECSTPVSPYGPVVKHGADYFTALGNSGIAKSTDGGLHWDFCTNGAGQSLFNNLISNGNTLFACSYGNGIWRTTNGGTSWQSCSIGLPNNAACYEMGKIGSTLFVGVNGAPNTIYKSTNNGNSWSEVAGTDWGRTEHFLTWGTTIFASSNAAVYKSSDNGVTWTVINHPELYGYPAGLATTSDGKLLVSSGQGFVWSPDNGTTWLSALEGLGNIRAGSLAVLNGKIFTGAGQSGVVWRNASELNYTEISGNKLNTNKLVLFPNPANSYVHIHLPTNETNIQVKLLSLEGRLVKHCFSTTYLDISDVKPGTYLVKVETDNQTLATKLVVH